VRCLKAASSVFLCGGLRKFGVDDEGKKREEKDHRNEEEVAET
jgi:hypothetical protein